MLRTAAVIVAFLAIGFVLGCGRDKPQPPAAQNRQDASDSGDPSAEG